MIDDSLQKQRLNTAIRLAGDKYDTTINLKVQSVIANLYALNREHPYIAALMQVAYKLEKSNRYVQHVEGGKPSDDDLVALKRNIDAVVARILGLKTKPRDEKVRWGTLYQKIGELAERTFDYYLEAESSKGTQPSEGATSSSVHNLRGMRSDLHNLRQTIDDKRAELFNKPRLLLRGEAGIGKTHLLCDYARERIDANKPTLMFLGHEFTHANDAPDPIKSMATILGFASRDVFIRNLKSLCRSSNERVCLIIDALNEGDQVKWSLLSELHSISGLSLVVSLRNGYEFVLSNRQKYVTIEHSGFSDMEWEAIPVFFKHHRVKLPEIPIIDPEFKNPLFLKLFCESYAGSRKTPRGHGATHVFEQYIERQSKKIIGELGLSVPKDYLWRNVIKAIGVWMGANGKDRILRPKLTEVINRDPTLSPHAARLVQLMEHDGLLVKYPHYTGGYKRSGYEYAFPYHRFSDHLIVRSVLTENKITGKDASPRAKEFLRRTKFLERIIRSGNEGLTEALAIQIPERCKGDELVWLAPKKYRGLDILKNAFIEGLKWRDVATFDGPSLKFVNSRQVVRYMNQYMSTYVRDVHQVFNCMLDVCAIPSHPFNAKRLHGYLIAESLAERDAWWQAFMLDGYGSGKAIDRLHSWSLSSLPSTATDDSIRLASIALMWTLASPNRVLRDTSTRALIALLTDRQCILHDLLSDIFRDCNDPYITERLFAVVLGCASLNPNDTENFKKITWYLYKNYFSDFKRRPDAMQDDYARATIEIFTREHPGVLRLRRRLYTPPYSYKFPSRIPSLEYLKQKYHDTKESDRYYSVWGSLMYGSAAIADFGNYTLGGKLRRFSSVKLTDKPPRTPDDDADKFRESLNPKQKALLDSYHMQYFSVIASIARRKLENGGSDTNITLEDSDEAPVTLEQFEKSLGFFKRRRYEKLKKFITGNGRNPRLKEHDFDLNIARRWIFTRVIGLGWNPKIHDEFDTTYARDGLDRSRTVKTERIGKKYQWIGLYEMAGLLGSNYWIKDEFSSRKPRFENYEGAYQIHLRDFDPTVDPRWLARRNSQKTTSSGWWIPKYDNFGISNWLSSTSDVPNPEQMITIEKDGQKYLNLHCWVTWKGEGSRPEDPDAHDHPELWVHINGYIVRKKQLAEVIEWCDKTEFWNRVLPEPNEESNDVFLGEFRGGTVYDSNFRSYYERSDWITRDKDRPFDILAPIESYSSSSFEGDGSIKENFDVFIPNHYLRKSMRLSPTGNAGEYTSGDGKIQFFDPSADDNPGREALLVSKEGFLAWLAEHDLTVMWTVLGEKMHFGTRDFSAGNIKRLEIHGFCYYDDKNRFINRVRFKDET